MTSTKVAAGVALTLAVCIALASALIAGSSCSRDSWLLFAPIGAGVLVAAGVYILTARHSLPSRLILVVGACVISSMSVFVIVAIVKLANCAE